MFNRLKLPRFLGGKTTHVPLPAYVSPQPVMSEREWSIRNARAENLGNLNGVNQIVTAFLAQGITINPLNQNDFSLLGFNYSGSMYAQSVNREKLAATLQVGRKHTFNVGHSDLHYGIKHLRRERVQIGEYADLLTNASVAIGPEHASVLLDVLLTDPNGVLLEQGLGNHKPGIVMYGIADGQPLVSLDDRSNILLPHNGITEERPYWFNNMSEQRYIPRVLAVDIPDYGSMGLIAQKYFAAVINVSVFTNDKNTHVWLSAPAVEIENPFE